MQIWLVPKITTHPQPQRLTSSSLYPQLIAIHPSPAMLLSSFSSSSCDFSFSKTLNPSLPPSFSSYPWKSLKKFPKSRKKFPKSLPKTLTPNLLRIQAFSQPPNSNFSNQNDKNQRRNPSVSAGRSKKKPGGSSGGRIEGNAEVRREAKKNARLRNKKIAESMFYRLKNPNRNEADKFTQDDLDMIGLGYDRMVRFMEKDDPNLRHPYDWFKYGEFGPYSWRGVVVGNPVRGKITDEQVTLIGEVGSHEEFEKIDQFEMAQDFGGRLNAMDRTVGFKYYWVFVRHPKWRVTELPWQQWTLVSEVVVQSGEKRLDKWNLMGRLGNKTRELITQCAAWMRPDIIYVKKPVYQCRFEPQTDFLEALKPLLDPNIEKNFLFELKHEDGRIEYCTYFAGLCKIVKANPKWFVDDVVNAYEKMNDEKKSKCLEFLLTNHPVQLLHPYTKEWKAKLEEMELGCDAPDEDEETTSDNNDFVDWIEVDDNDNGEDYEDDDQDENYVMEDNGEEGGEETDEEDEEEELGIREEEEGSSVKETEEYWEDELKKAFKSREGMESLIKKSIKTSNSIYERQIKGMEEQEKQRAEMEMSVMEGMMKENSAVEVVENSKEERRRVKVGKEEWKLLGYGPWRRRVKKSRLPPELFLRAAVRPFTYRNLVKEIVLMRHAIIDGDISGYGQG